MSFRPLWLIFFLLPKVTGTAAVLDWGTVGYTLGTVNSDVVYTNVGGSGVDIIFRINTTFPSGGTMTGISPDDTTLGANSVLVLQTDLANKNTEFITVNFSFYVTGTGQTVTVPVNNVSFSLYDVDQTVSGVTNQDRIRNYTTSPNLAITRLGVPLANDANRTATPQEFDSANNGITTGPEGSAALGSAVIGTGDVASASDPGILFNYGSDQLITGPGSPALSFVYDAGPDASVNPTTHTIWVSSVNFSPIPEPSTWVAAALLLVVILASYKRRVVSSMDPPSAG